MKTLIIYRQQHLQHIFCILEFNPQFHFLFMSILSAVLQIYKSPQSQNQSLSKKKEKAMEKTTSSLPKSKSETWRRQPPIWDSGSSLYDSFELNSFQKQLNSAMAAATPIIPRTFSMPQSFNRHPPTPLPPPQDIKRRGAKITRALQRLFRSVFRTKRRESDNKNATFEEEEEEEEGIFKEEIINKERFYYIFYHKSGALSSIPETAEFDGPPESRKLVRRTTSARVTGLTSSLGIYC